MWHNHRYFYWGTISSDCQPRLNSASSTGKTWLYPARCHPSISRPHGIIIIIIIIIISFVFSSRFRCYLHMLQNIKIILLHWNIQFAHRNIPCGFLTKQSSFLVLISLCTNTFFSSGQIFNTDVSIGPFLFWIVWYLAYRLYNLGTGITGTIFVRKQ